MVKLQENSRENSKKYPGRSLEQRSRTFLKLFTKIWKNFWEGLKVYLHELIISSNVLQGGILRQIW